MVNNDQNNIQFKDNGVNEENKINGLTQINEKNNGEFKGKLFKYTIPVVINNGVSKNNQQNEQKLMVPHNTHFKGKLCFYLSHKVCIAGAFNIFISWNVNIFISLL